MSTDPLEPEQDEMEDDGMTRMVNVSDDPIIVRISHGQRVQKVKVQPQDSHPFPSGYCCDVKGAGRLTLLPILTRQSLRADKVPRLVREELAEEARENFEARTYGTAEANISEVERLREELAAAEAKQEYVASKGGKTTATAAVKKPKKAKSKR